MRKNNLLQTVGFKPKAQSQSAPQQHIKTINGKKYKRGPNGEAIEVP